MTRFLSTLAALAVLTGTAMAADAPGTVKAPGKVSANYDWRGVYVGIEGGYAFGNADGAVTLGGTTFGADYDIKGYLYGIKIGAQEPLTFTPFMLGIEAFIDKTNIDGSGTVSNTGGVVSAKADIKWLAGAHVKIAYPWNNLLPYATVGGACAQNTLTLSAAGFGSITSSNYYSCGWSAGAGLDWALMQNIILGVSYLHVDLGNANPSFPIVGGVGVSVPSNRDLDVVKASVSWKL